MLHIYCSHKLLDAYRSRRLHQSSIENDNSHVFLIFKFQRIFGCFKKKWQLKKHVPNYFTTDSKFRLPSLNNFPVRFRTQNNATALLTNSEHLLGSVLRELCVTTLSGNRIMGCFPT